MRKNFIGIAVTTNMHKAAAVMTMGIYMDVEAAKPT